MTTNLFATALLLIGCYSGVGSPGIDTTAVDTEITSAVETTDNPSDETGGTESQAIEVEDFLGDQDLVFHIPLSWYPSQEGGLVTAASFPAPHSGMAEILPAGLKINFLPYIPSTDPTLEEPGALGPDWTKSGDVPTQDTVVFYINRPLGIAVVGSKKGSSLTTNDIQIVENVAMSVELEETP